MNFCVCGAEDGTPRWARAPPASSTRSSAQFSVLTRTRCDRQVHEAAGPRGRRQRDSNGGNYFTSQAALEAFEENKTEDETPRRYSITTPAEPAPRRQPQRPRGTGPAARPAPAERPGSSAAPRNAALQRRAPPHGTLSTRSSSQTEWTPQLGKRRDVQAREDCVTKTEPKR